MISLIRMVEEDKNPKESKSSSANHVSYPLNNNIANLNERRNEKALSKARDKVLKAAAKINW